MGEANKLPPLPARDAAKPAEQQGMFKKFDVQRTDRSSNPGGKHFGCEYFVLDVDHDPHAMAALAAYADSVEATHPELAADMRGRYQLSKAVREAVPEQPKLTVRLTCFPESNGKTNWTALLVRAGKWGGLIGNCGGISLARGELWNRVAWRAECARFLIGERDTEPHILDYGDDIRTPEEWKGEVELKERMERKAMIAAAQEAK